MWPQISGILDFGFWGFWILDLGDFGFWILDSGDFGFWILGILDLGFWIWGILDFGFWGFWILEFGPLCSKSLCEAPNAPNLGDFGFWILGILGILDFGFWILGILDFGFWCLGILDFGSRGFCDKFWMLHKKRRLCTPNRVGGFLSITGHKSLQGVSPLYEQNPFTNHFSTLFGWNVFLVPLSSRPKKRNSVIEVNTAKLKQRRPVVIANISSTLQWPPTPWTQDPCWCFWSRQMLVLRELQIEFLSVLFLVIWQKVHSKVMWCVMSKMLWVRQHSWSRPAKVWDIFQGTWWSNRNHLLVPDRSWQFLSYFGYPWSILRNIHATKDAVLIQQTSLNDSNISNKQWISSFVATDFDLSRFMGSLKIAVFKAWTWNARWRL